MKTIATLRCTQVKLVQKVARVISEASIDGKKISPTWHTAQGHMSAIGESWRSDETCLEAQVGGAPRYCVMARALDSLASLRIGAIDAVMHRHIDDMWRRHQHADAPDGSRRSLAGTFTLGSFPGRCRLRGTRDRDV